MDCLAALEFAIFTESQDMMKTGPSRRNTCLRLRRSGSREGRRERRGRSPTIPSLPAACARSRRRVGTDVALVFSHARVLQRDVAALATRSGETLDAFAPPIVRQHRIAAPAGRTALPRRRVVAASPRFRDRCRTRREPPQRLARADRSERRRSDRTRRRLAHPRRSRRAGRVLSSSNAAAMSNAPFVAASLIARSSSYRTQPAPLAAVAQRLPVLARSPHMAQQLSLFGPPGGRR
jgi:hypothetical protein